jgi:hypothetical protein
MCLRSPWEGADIGQFGRFANVLWKSTGLPRLPGGERTNRSWEKDNVVSKLNAPLNSKRSFFHFTCSVPLILSGGKYVKHVDVGWDPGRNSLDMVFKSFNSCMQFYRYVLYSPLVSSLMYFVQTDYKCHFRRWHGPYLCHRLTLGQGAHRGNPTRSDLPQIVEQITV